MRRALVPALALAALLAGCAVSRASSVPVSKELAADCQRHCGILEMRLAAVIVVSNAGGCVCEPKAAPGQAPTAPAPGGAAAAAGGAIVTSLAAAQQQERATVTSTPPEAPSVR